MLAATRRKGEATLSPAGHFGNGPASLGRRPLPTPGSAPVRYLGTVTIRACSGGAFVPDVAGAYADARREQLGTRSS
jgi:hypothetical protein